MAPEIIKGKNYNEKVDIWSIGIITYMLLIGKNPYPGKNK
jgi:serine/threonine protein kinase